MAPEVMEHDRPESVYFPQASVLSSIISNSQEVEVTQMSINL